MKKPATTINFDIGSGTTTCQDLSKKIKNKKKRKKKYKIKTSEPCMNGSLLNDKEVHDRDKCVYTSQEKLEASLSFIENLLIPTASLYFPTSSLPVQ